MGRHRETVDISVQESTLLASSSVVLDIIGPEPRSGPICFCTIVYALLQTHLIRTSQRPPKPSTAHAPAGPHNLAQRFSAAKAVRRTEVPEARHRRITREKSC